MEDVMEDAFGLFLQLMLEWLLRLLIPVLASAVIAGITYGVKWARQKLGEARWIAVLEAVRFAVYAAEQSSLSGQLADLGKSKKDYAIGVAQALLDERGIHLRVAQIADLIEGELAKTLNIGKIGGGLFPRSFDA